MIIRFRNNRLKKQYTNYKEAQRAFGANVARKYIERINIFVFAKDIAELIKLPGLRCHQLKGNRVGQWAIKLTGFYRLIFTLEGERLEIVCIEEVSKHYGD